MTGNIFRIHPADTVAVALEDLAAGAAIACDGQRLVLSDPVARGHKLALVAHEPGHEVIKYGQPIGRASAAISPGAWVHTHNLVTLLGPDMAHRWHGPAAPLAVPASDRQWLGYDRGAQAGTRNEIWILPTVGCVARTAQRVAELASARHAGRLDGIHAFTHPFGCSQLGDDLDATRAILARLAAHPNAGGVLLIGLGCESNQLSALLATLPESVRAKLRSVTAQDAADETRACLDAIDALFEIAAPARRQPLPLSRLCVGLKCGGSDGLSGLTANPLLGRFSETLTASGGSAILTEIPEIFGAEHLLLGRAESPALFEAGMALVDDFKDYFRRNGEPVSENPSPGNIAGGITTLEEKSLGAVQKAGRSPVAAIVGYGGLAAPSNLTLLEAPGNDAVSSTALAAAGATMILFTTGRGTPLGFPVPTVKVASNSQLAALKPGWIDFDAGPCLDRPLAEMDAAFLDLLVEIASGRATAAEQSGQREIAIWKRGVTL